MVGQFFAMIETKVGGLYHQRRFIPPSRTSASQMNLSSFFLVLMTHDAWRQYSKFTLRLSWPASVSDGMIYMTPSREINRLTPTTSTLQSFLSSYMTRTLLPHVSPGRIRRRQHRRTPQPRQSSESITPVYGSSTPASSLQYPYPTYRTPDFNFHNLYHSI
jgi:hypothetical protein